jgi:hypothetical protein
MTELHNPFAYLQNVKVLSIFWSEGVAIETKDGYEIIPYGQEGEMSWTLWFEVRDKNGRVFRYNGSFIEGYEIEAKG